MKRFFWKQTTYNTRSRHAGYYFSICGSGHSYGRLPGQDILCYCRGRHWHKNGLWPRPGYHLTRHFLPLFYLLCLHAVLFFNIPGGKQGAEQ